MSITLITGAGKGIGLATALHFGRNGNRVFAALRDPDNAEDLAQAIAAEQLPVTLVQIDVDDEVSVRRGIANVLDQAGHIDVLVNNAGVGIMGPLEEVSLEAAQRVFQTNYFGPIRTMQAVLPGMRERCSGTIVNVSSVFGQLVLAAHVHYPASKFALEAASEALAQEVGAFNIRIALVEPGVVLTPMMESGKARRKANPPDINGPYTNHRRRLGMFFDSGLSQPTLPQTVAEVIEHAVVTDTPQMRYVVGEDAQALIDGRQKTTDEEWANLGQTLTDEEYCASMAQICGVDLFNKQ